MGSVKCTRITSYNVCYTKLLRFGFAFFVFDKLYMAAISVGHLERLIRVGHGDDRLEEFLEGDSQTDKQAPESLKNFAEIGTHLKIPSVVLR